ncbi:MAG: AraC family transcriptional regulator [Verrucomicrobiae bacterium]|nr:AraC family transcriptional regulator [Verrucomicrobiae bacterium]
MLKFREIFRPSRNPSVNLPMGVRSAGHYRLAPGFQSPVRTKQFVQFFFGVAGTGVVVMNKAARKLGPGQAALYFPGDLHCFYSQREEWEFCWWTMDGPLAASMTAAFGLAGGRIYDVGPLPQALFRKMVAALGDVTPGGEYRASQLAYELLSRAVRGGAKTVADPEVAAAMEIIHNEWSNPLLSVESIAQRLRLHRSSFSRRFRVHAGVSPVKYLTMFRLQNALTRLKSSRQSIAEIAAGCGWADPAYFCHCVHLATGCSPRDFRRQ